MVPKLELNREMGTWDGEHALVVGQTRFGKTFFSKRVCRFFPYVMIHDPKNRYTTGWEHEYRVHTIEQLYEVDPYEHPWVIYAPLEAEREDMGAREEFCKYCLDRGNCFVLFDELNRMSESPTVYPPSMRYLYTGGAEAGICVMGLTQEPIRLPSFVLTQSARIYAFFISNSSHREKLEGFMPLEDEQVEKLQKYEFLYWRNDMQKISGPWWL
jgi:hypothetical protein